MKQSLITSIFKEGGSRTQNTGRTARSEHTPLRGGRTPSPAPTAVAPATPPSPATPSVPQLSIVRDDFHAVVAELACDGPTPYELASKACPWYTLALRRECFETALSVFDRCEGFATCGDRCACLTMQIFEDVLATATVAEASTIETLDVAICLASKLSETTWVRPSKTHAKINVEDAELAMLGALHWRLPRTTPYYILSVLCNEVWTAPARKALLEKKAVSHLTFLVYKDVYATLKQRALAALVAFRAALKLMKMDFHSVYKIPDLYGEIPAIVRALTEKHT